MTARQGAQAALALGLLASLAGNALAAEPTGLGRLVAAWAPLALCVVTWLVEHHRPAPGPWRAATWGGTAVVAGVAAWVSYWHLVELARMAGEEGIAAHLLPLSVDGLIVVASAYLRDSDTRPAPKAAPARKVAPATTPAPAGPATPKVTRAQVTPVQPTATAEPVGERARQDVAPATPARGTAAAELVRRLAAEHPDWTQAELAAAAGCSVRTVRRHLAGTTSDAGAGVDEGQAEAVLDEDLDALLDQLTMPAPEAAATNGAHA